MQQKKIFRKSNPLTSRFSHSDLDLEISARKFQIKVHKRCKMVYCTYAYHYALLLRKNIYGLVQSARKFYEKLIDVLKVIGFFGSKSDPCLWTMLDEKVNQIIIIGIYVNNCLIIGKEENIDHLIDELKRHEFNPKVERNVNEYLSCCIKESKDERKLTIIQPHLLTRLIKNFGEEIEGKLPYCRSRVWMLLYLTKYSQPDISNIV
jgi:hypothetical protein